MQSDKTRLVREIANATNLDFTYVENTLNEIISDDVELKTDTLVKEIKAIKKTLKKMQSDMQFISSRTSSSVNVKDYL